MKKMMKRVVAGALALSMTVLMAACGGSDESTGSVAQTSSGSTAGATSIKVWVSSGAEDDVYRETFDKMETELGITINDEYYPKDELDSKLQVAPVVGDAPDMIDLSRQRHRFKHKFALFGPHGPTSLFGKRICKVPFSSL